MSIRTTNSTKTVGSLFLLNLQNKLSLRKLSKLFSDQLITIYLRWIQYRCRRFNLTHFSCFVSTVWRTYEK